MKCSRQAAGRAVARPVVALPGVLALLAGTLPLAVALATAPSLPAHAGRSFANAEFGYGGEARLSFAGSPIAKEALVERILQLRLTRIEIELDKALERSRALLAAGPPHLDANAEPRLAGLATVDAMPSVTADRILPTLPETPFKLASTAPDLSWLGAPVAAATAAPTMPPVRGQVAAWVIVTGLSGEPEAGDQSGPTRPRRLARRVAALSPPPAATASAPAAAPIMPPAETDSEPPVNASPPAQPLPPLPIRKPKNIPKMLGDDEDDEKPPLPKGKPASKPAAATYSSSAGGSSSGTSKLPSWISFDSNSSR